ncbi:hypothetical protein BGX21_003432, partial [Mortierella sp. AD011]
FNSQQQQQQQQQKQNPNLPNVLIRLAVPSDQLNLRTLNSPYQKKRDKKRPMAAQSLLETMSSSTNPDTTMATPENSLETMGDHAAGSAASGNGVPDFVKKLFRQVLFTDR